MAGAHTQHINLFINLLFFNRYGFYSSFRCYIMDWVHECVKYSFNSQLVWRTYSGAFILASESILSQQLSPIMSNTVYWWNDTDVMGTMISQNGWNATTCLSFKSNFKTFQSQHFNTLLARKPHMAWKKSVVIDDEPICKFFSSQKNVQDWSNVRLRIVKWKFVCGFRIWTTGNMLQCFFERLCFTFQTKCVKVQIKWSNQMKKTKAKKREKVCFLLFNFDKIHPGILRFNEKPLNVWSFFSFPFRLTVPKIRNLLLIEHLQRNCMNNYDIETITFFCSNNDHKLCSQ